MLRASLLLLALLTAATASAQAQGGRLSIIIDDVGYSAANGERTLQLPEAVTLAVLPHTPHGARLARAAHARGQEVMLHIPMSNNLNLPLDAGGLDQDMDYATFMVALREGLASIPHVVGVNNHMGSRLTEEATPMGWLMTELFERNLYFIDSRTSARSQAQDQAHRYGVPHNRRDVFLDNIRDPELIAVQLELAFKLAEHRGSAIAIGHPYPETLAVLETLDEWLTHYDVELVPASALLKTAKNGSGQCLAPPQTLWHQPQRPQKVPTVSQNTLLISTERWLLP
ncbi:divergent polysaccharide deacetylase family protein [Marinimicrobium alkaliphilum]|uniref:divergent polysaccharide deacetylase family protein n=1 Tax=Marinimicrobium alkaliphilum TaxID=2202654 RepID=UPI000DB924D4|nr:divergent polysaccharide deacetylase family protein [Marinimicrobium alkaliphilum]